MQKCENSIKQGENMQIIRQIIIDNAISCF
jgi:hypothetical protein